GDAILLHPHSFDEIGEGERPIEVTGLAVDEELHGWEIFAGWESARKYSGRRNQNLVIPTEGRNLLFWAGKAGPRHALAAPARLRAARNDNGLAGATLPPCADETSGSQCGRNNWPAPESRNRAGPIRPHRSSSPRHHPIP